MSVICDVPQKASYLFQREKYDETSNNLNRVVAAKFKQEWTRTRRDSPNQERKVIAEQAISCC
jgi:hypothetical protein